MHPEKAVARIPMCKACGSSTHFTEQHPGEGTRYAAPSPPSSNDARREEWRRKHGLGP